MLEGLQPWRSKVVFTSGCALFVLGWWAKPLETSVLRGRRLFVVSDGAVYKDDSFLPPELQAHSAVSTEWQDGYQAVAAPLDPQDLMKLFKTAAASPQDALQRMSLSGTPNLEQWSEAISDWKWGLSRSEIATIFHGIDANGDGEVTLSELLACFRHGYQPVAVAHPAAVLPPEAPHVLLPHGYDCTDGVEMWRLAWSQEKTRSCSLISASDLRQHLQPGITAKQIIQAADHDGDGAISNDEWTVAATHAGDVFVEPVSEPQADFAFKSMDVGQDGALSANDLSGALELSAPTFQEPGLRHQSVLMVPMWPHGRHQGHEMDAKTLNSRLLAKWSTLSNAFSKMDADGNHQLSHEEWRAGLAELNPPIPPSAAAYLFDGVDGLRDGRITPPELHGTLTIGKLFQSPEALRKAVHWNKAAMEHHKKVSSWIHDAKPNWQHDQPASAAAGHPKAPKDSQKESLVQSMRGAFADSGAAFRAMDVDHSDDASLAEFKEGLKHFQPPVLGAQADQAFQNLDTDGNAKVSKGEFGALDTAMPTGGSLNKNMQELMSKAEDEFRQQAAKWAGSMEAACAQLGSQISLARFESTIHSFEPLLSASAEQEIFNQMDSDHNGFISPAECRLNLEDFRKVLGKAGSLRNAFADADANNDHQLTREEFGAFGQMLDKENTKGKYAVFFDDELDSDHDGFVALPSLETLLGSSTGASSILLSSKELSSYHLPAVVHGKCVLSASGAKVSPGLRDQVGKAFTQSLGKQLQIPIELVGVQEVAHPYLGGGKQFDLLFTSKTSSGAEVIQKLHAQAAEVQHDVEAAISQVTSADKVQAWCSSTLDFYGPKAGKLPKGSKIKEVFGQAAHQPQ